MDKDYDKEIQELRDQVADLGNMVADIARSDIRYTNIEEIRYGLQVNHKLIVPKKNITSGGSCPNIGEIAQRTNTDGDLYICGRNNTWEKVGSQ